MKLHTLAAAALSTLCCLAQGADRPAYSVTDYIYATFDSPVSVGFVFTANQNVSVTALGYWDQFLDGLADDHAVGIYSDTGSLLISAEVQAGVAGALIGEYRYAALGSAFALTAGDVYVLVAHATSPDGYTAAMFPPAVLDADPAISIGPAAGRYLYSPALAFPVNPFYDMYATANMLFAGAAPAPPVPEAQTWALMLAGIGALAWVVRRRQRGA